jgi:hypothetical protein
MKQMKLMLVAVCILSASVASAAVTSGVIDFSIAEGDMLDPVNGYLDTTTGLPVLTAFSSNLDVTSGAGEWNQPAFYGGHSSFLQFDFATSSRITGFDLGSNSGSPDMTVWGILGSVSTVLYQQDDVVGALVNHIITDPTAYDSIKFKATQADGKIDNISWAYGELDPPTLPAPTPVPAPGALVLAGIGTCFASWMRKRKLA